MNEIVLSRKGNYIHTEGLKKYINSEIIVLCDESSYEEYVRYMLSYITSYVIQSEVNIRKGETLLYGSWIISFQEISSEILEVWEYDLSFTSLIRGAKNASELYYNQINIGDNFKSLFVPPKPDHKIVISDGVLEGYGTHGVRYKSPDHMSGWWLTTELYNGDTNSLKIINVCELFQYRMDVCKLLSLDFGFRFAINSSEAQKSEFDIWFDETVLEDNE